MSIAVFSANDLDTGSPLFIVKDDDGNQLFELRDKGVFPCGSLSVYANVQPLASREQIAQEIEELPYYGSVKDAIENAAKIARGEHDPR